MQSVEKMFNFIYLKNAMDHIFRISCYEFKGQYEKTLSGFDFVVRNPLTKIETVSVIYCLLNLKAKTQCHERKRK